MMDMIAPLLAATLSAGTPLAIAALGLLLNERAGVVNLGAEGIMLVSAVTGFAVAHHSGDVVLATLAAALSGALLAGLLAVLVVWLNANQYASGLALSLLAAGLSSLVGLRYLGVSLPVANRAASGGGGDQPDILQAMLGQHPLVWLAIAIAVVVHLFLYRSRAGLALRAVGESPASAHAQGYPVRWVRTAALMAGGALCGVAGAYLSLVYTPLWADGMVAGRGWIALALTTFATWRPARVLAGAYLFGGVTMLQFHLQAAGVQLASQLLSMLPYVATVIALALMSRNPAWIRANMPASLGKPFHPEGG